jgi:hypothetical protein
MSKSNASARAGNAKVMNRADLTRRLVARLKGEEAVIGGIGNTNFDLWAAGQRPQNFYMLGSMGLAFPIALSGARLAMCPIPCAPDRKARACSTSSVRPGPSTASPARASDRVKRPHCAKKTSNGETTWMGLQDAACW